MPYLEDFIFFLSTPEEHLEKENLRLVSERFCAHNLKINPDKCVCFRMKVQSLSHIVSKDGLEVDPSRMEALQKLPVPWSQTEVKLSLGLDSYYRRFALKFAEIGRPLHGTSETSTKFTWTLAAQDAFESLKLTLTRSPIFAFPYLEEPFVHNIDASHFAMGAVLVKVQDTKERTICYASKLRSKSQTKYTAPRPELLTPVSFKRHFRHYLVGQKFTIELIIGLFNGYTVSRIPME